jgi:hypothetical protein
MDPGRRHRNACPAAPRDPAAAVLRRVRRRRPAPERLYPGAAAARALTPAGQAGNYPVLLIDGVVGGVWHQQRSGRKLAITVEPLRELTARQHRQLHDEVDLVSTVMATATLTVGPVTAGPHA